MTLRYTLDFPLEGILSILGLIILICLFIAFTLNYDPISKARKLVKTSLYISSIILSICMVGVLLHVDNIETKDREQIVEDLADRGYEVLDPNEITFYDYDVHEISIIKPNKDIFKLAYRIGRCGCYYYVYKIEDNEYVAII